MEDDEVIKDIVSHVSLKHTSAPFYVLNLGYSPSFFFFIYMMGGEGN